MEGTRWSLGGNKERGGSRSSPHLLPLAPAVRGERPAPSLWAWNALTHHPYLGNPQKDFPHSSLPPLHLRALGCLVPGAFIKYYLEEQIFVFLRLLLHHLPCIPKTPLPHSQCQHIYPQSVQEVRPR